MRNDCDQPSCVRVCRGGVLDCRLPDHAPRVREHTCCVRCSGRDRSAERAATVRPRQGQSDHLPGPSTIVKYDRAGHIVDSVAIEGRCDGLRLNPDTKKLWALFNNDGQNGNPKRQPLLYTIDPKTLAATKYAFPAVQPHGGGYDDIAFIDGQAFLSASSPTLTAAGINEKPIVVSA